MSRAAAGERGMPAGGVDDEAGPGGEVVRVDGAIRLQRPAALAHEHGQGTIEAGPVEMPPFPGADEEEVARHHVAAAPRRGGARPAVR